MKWRFKKEPFRVLEVDFYCQGGPEVLAACMEKKYQEILIDFGEVSELHLYLRLDRR